MGQILFFGHSDSTAYVDWEILIEEAKKTLLFWLDSTLMYFPDETLWRMRRISECKPLNSIASPIKYFPSQDPPQPPLPLPSHCLSQVNSSQENNFHDSQQLDSIFHPIHLILVVKSWWQLDGNGMIKNGWCTNSVPVCQLFQVSNCDLANKNWCDVEQKFCEILGKKLGCQRRMSHYCWWSMSSVWQLLFTVW